MRLGILPRDVPSVRLGARIAGRKNGLTDYLPWVNHIMIWCRKKDVGMATLSLLKRNLTNPFTGRSPAEYSYAQ